MKRAAALSALRHRDYRLIWFGQSVSVLGTQIQTVALAWIVYDLTGSPAQLGGIGLARALPMILFSLFGGTLADQMDRRRLLLVSQTVMALLAAAIAVAVSAGLSSIPLFYAFASLSAAASAFDGPARQAIIPSLVPREHLPNALALNVLAMDTAAVLGPALGGLVIGALGVSAAFWIDAVSFLAVVLALVGMRARPATPQPARRGWGSLVDGLQFVRERAILWQLMVIDFLATLFVSSMGLLPVFARDVLAIGPSGLGLLYSAPSAGAVVGAAIFALMPSPRRPGRMVALAIGGYGLVLALFGMAPGFLTALVLLATAGGLDAVSMAMRHTVRQLATPDGLRGRVGALGGVFSAGGPRLGEFQAGVMASLIGPRGAMVAGGAACVLMVLSSRAWARTLWAYTGEELTRVSSEPATEPAVESGTTRAVRPHPHPISGHVSPD